MYHLYFQFYTIIDAYSKTIVKEIIKIEIKKKV